MGQKQVTDAVEIGKITRWMIMGSDTVQAKGILVIKQLNNEEPDIQNLHCNFQLAEQTFITKVQEVNDTIYK